MLLALRGVNAIADFLSNEVNARANVGDSATILIGHSMGGMIAKEIDLRQNAGNANSFTPAGIITMGSPLDGARIINSFESRWFRWWKFGYGSRVYGLTRSVGYNLGRCTLPGGGIIGVSLAQAFNNKAVNLTTGVGVSPIGFGLFRHFSPASGPTWEDLREGGYNQFRSGTNTATPKVNIWGNIQRPAFETVLDGTGGIGTPLGDINLGNTYRDVVNYTQLMYNIYRWVPGIGMNMSRRMPKCRRLLPLYH